MSGSAQGCFSAGFRAELADLMRWRRDVRHFRTDPIEDRLLARCLDSFNLAPSVGLSEPWRLIRVESPASREKVVSNFEAMNAHALAGYSGDKALCYAGLKLAGLRDAPVHLAVFCDDSTPQGAGLGAGTMPETRAYSVVGAITLFWLAARAEGLGLGWVSILDPVRLAEDLDAPVGWGLVGYLCVGWPEATHDTPELERVGWERRAPSLWIESR